MIESIKRVLTPEALDFLAELDFRFGQKVLVLMYARKLRQEYYDKGGLPKLADSTDPSEWRPLPIPQDLLDRRVEITGPADNRKMVINALNSGANAYMADFEDSLSDVTYGNLIQGQINLMDAVRKTITFQTPEKTYKLNEKTAVLMVRPRGWHMTEPAINGGEMSASLYDFGLYFFHNIHELLKQGTSTYFYLPKMESADEARLWAQVFQFSERRMGLPRGTIKATCLIETLPAAFEMDNIIYELRDHIVGLNCGRWDYIFSFIKRFSSRADKVLPDRSQLTMDKGFLQAYSRLLINTCHRRGIHAMGGMSAQIPIKGDPEANDKAMGKVRDDKIREAIAGHDGTWVAHPGMVALAKEIFDYYMGAGPNQITVRPEYAVSEADLLTVPSGTRTMEGLRHNIRVALQYIESWQKGVGCVPLYNLMEDAATAEISRSQVWQWLRHGATVDGVVLTSEVFESVLAEETSRLPAVGAEAIDLFSYLVNKYTFAEFLTTA